MKRKVVRIVTALLLALLGFAMVSVAAASTPKKTTTTTKPKTTKTTKTTKTATTTSAASTTSTTPSALMPTDTTPKGPADKFFVINGTANAASDHEIAGTSAFPNFTTGAVDNYYSMSHAHVDNSPFAEGTASPLDTGPIGQTAAAGNFQQPQYADARWPGDTNSASFGTQGQPSADAKASSFSARGDASEASQPLTGPKLDAPKGFNGRLRAALAKWKAKWEDRLNGRLNNPTKPVSVPARTTPTATVPTPIATITTPSVPLPGLQTPPPPVTVPVPLPPVPRTSAPETSTTPSRSLASTPPAPPSSAPSDGITALTSKSAVMLDPHSDALVTAGESSLGRVVLGGGQIVIKKIYVSAEITNDGTSPSDRVVVDIADATIGGVPVTIDQDGVHIAGQNGAVPYSQASDQLNAALSQAGIKLFLVGPEITNNSCNQGSGSGGSNSGSTTGNTTTTSTDQSTTNSGSGSCPPPSSSSSSCDQSGSGTTTTSATPTPPTPPTSNTSTTTTSTDSSCAPPPSSCDQSSATTTTSTTTTSSSPLSPSPTTTSKSKTGTTPTTTTTTTSGSCGSGMTSSSGACATTGTTNTTTSSMNDQTGTTTDTTSSSYFQLPGSGGSNNSGEETITATGLHVVFTQPVQQSGVPAQYAEHILGEVYLDSLAVPAVPLTLPSLGLNSASSSASGYGTGSGSASCLAGGKASSGLSSSSRGSSSVLGASSSGSSSPSGFASGPGSSQPGSSATGSALPTRVASFLRKKPLWVLFAFLVWQALAIGTGASLWKWQQGGPS